MSACAILLVVTQANGRAWDEPLVLKRSSLKGEERRTGGGDLLLAWFLFLPPPFILSTRGPDSLLQSPGPFASIHSQWRPQMEMEESKI